MVESGGSVARPEASRGVLTYRFQGRDFRLKDVHGKLVEKLLA